MKILKRLWCLPALLWGVVALGQTPPSLQTDWMELVKGYRDTGTGTELREVDGADAEGPRTITLAVPKKAIGDPNAIEEVVVVGRKPEKPQPLLDYSYEWVQDYDKDNYGLVIHLGKGSNWPIRLFFYSDTGFTH